MQAIRTQTVVLPGGVADIRSPDLPPPGTPMEVVVLFGSEAVAKDPQPPLSSLVGACKGMFKSPEEADTYLNRERDSWIERKSGSTS